MEKSEIRKKLIKLKRDLVELQRIGSYKNVSKEKLMVDRIKIETKIKQLEEQYECNKKRI